MGWKRSGRMALALAALCLSGAALAADRTYCGESPSLSPEPLSVGRPAKGRLLGGVPLLSDAAARLLPLRHASRCLNWATPRLVAALRRAGLSVLSAFPGSPPLGVGDLSKAGGGPIPPYSRSHQSGRDADLAFYRLDAQGAPLVAEDLVRFDARGSAAGGTGRFDAPRTWRLVRALLEDATIQVKWMFISNPLRRKLLDEAEREGAPPALLAQAAEVLHQPSDAPPHDDHIHLRIRCSEEERRHGCAD